MATRKTKQTEGAQPQEVETTQTEVSCWKKLIPDKYIDVSNEWYSRNGIDPNNLTEEEKKEIKDTKVNESDLMILLGGFKEAAHARGLISVDYTIYEAKEDFVSLGCRLVIKTEDGEGTADYMGLACASKENTNFPFNGFLISMAENRAFIRAVRMALNINVLGKEEVNERPVTIIGSNGLLSSDGECMSPQESLAILTEKVGRNFSDLKNKLVKNEKAYPGAKEWQGFEDVPSETCFLVINDILAKKK